MEVPRKVARAVVALLDEVRTGTGYRTADEGMAA
jgi:hypothetical protein